MTISPELQTIMARIKARVEDPAYQRQVAEWELTRIQDAKRAKTEAYTRRIEHLSRLHIGFVRQHCGSDMMPMGTVPTIWAKLIAEWNWDTSVLLVGKTSTQKTTSATWAAMWCACDGETIFHTTALRIATAPPDTMVEWQQADLLIVDELHRLDGQPEWKRGPVWDLIDCRYQSQGTTIVCATVDPKAMADIAGAEVLRRIPLKLTAVEEG